MAKAKTIIRAPNLLKPHILAELRRRGGSAEVGERGRPGTDRDLYDIVAESVGVTASERNLTLADLDPEYHSRVAAGHRATDKDADRNAWDYTMLVAVQQLKEAGLIAKGTRRGRWELTVRGAEPTYLETPTDATPTGPAAHQSLSDRWFDFQVEHGVGIDLFGDDEDDENEAFEPAEGDVELTADELAFLDSVRDDGPAEEPLPDDGPDGVLCQELLAFYGEDGGPAGNGYTRRQLLAWSDADWEREHDFIQWLFPFDYVSRFNPEAPVVDKATAAAFRADPLLRHRLRQSYDRWLDFCGVGRSDTGLVFARPRPHIWDRENHNWWRVTRVLRSLALLGLTDEAVEFFLLLESVRPRVGAETWSHWRAAVEPIWIRVVLAKSELQG